MFTRVVFVLILFIVSGCITTGPASLDKSYSFDSDPEKGFLVFDSRRALASEYGRSFYTYIQPVNIADRKFTGRTISVASCKICMNFDKSYYFGDPTSNNELQAILIPAGHYAITGTLHHAHGFGKTYTCYNKGTRVFEVKAGTIGLYPSRFPQFQSDSDRLIKLKGYIAEYPEITGKVEIIKTAGKITFEGSEKFIGEDCAYSAGNWFVLHDDKGAIVF
ncbi:MAG: hypothetical protein ABJN40_11110 [Sneathiella sp.]